MSARHKHVERLMPSRPRKHPRLITVLERVRLLVAP